MTETLGYVASLLVAVSLMLRSVAKLRVVNLLGALCFAIYGFLIHSWPVAGMNAFIVGINLYHLNKLLRAKAEFTVIEVRPDSTHLQAFLDFYRNDLAKFFDPQVWSSPHAEARVFMILRAAAPVGIVIAETIDKQTLAIHVDYVTPDYRDLKPGRHFYEEHAPRLASEGIKNLTATAGTKQHEAYLRAIGFSHLSSRTGEPRYVRSV